MVGIEEIKAVLRHNGIVFHMAPDESQPFWQIIPRYEDVYQACEGIRRCFEIENADSVIFCSEPYNDGGVRFVVTKSPPEHSSADRKLAEIDERIADLQRQREALLDAEQDEAVRAMNASIKDFMEEHRLNEEKRREAEKTMTALVQRNTELRWEAACTALRHVFQQRPDLQAGLLERREVRMHLAELTDQFTKEFFTDPVQCALDEEHVFKVERLDDAPSKRVLIYNEHEDCWTYGELPRMAHAKQRAVEKRVKMLAAFTGLELMITDASLYEAWFTTDELCALAKEHKWTLFLHDY